MAQKFFYVVEHFVPFPQSEYGGLWNVIAEDDDECFDLITAEDQEFSVSHYPNLRHNIQSARVYPLLDGVESGIIEVFLT